MARTAQQDSAHIKPRRRPGQPGRKIQQSLFDQKPKRGRPALKPHDHFGGAYLKDYNPKSKRPMDSKKALHLVLRSSKATGARSFKHEKHEARVWEIISTHAEKTGVRIYEFANGGNHLHLLIRATRRENYRRFIRTVTGLIARQVCNTERGRSRPNGKGIEQGRPLSQGATQENRGAGTQASKKSTRNTKEKFWDARPFSRIVSFAKQEFRAVKKYLLRNTLEAMGWIPYVMRGRRLPQELRFLLGMSTA